MNVQTSCFLVAALLLTPVLRGAEPADPQLIPEAREVLDYFESIYGKKVLSGVSGMKNARNVHAATGKYPAILAIDLSGWNSPRWGKTYTPVVQRAIDTAKAWHADGGIVAMQFHWKHPMKEKGTAWIGKHGKNPPSGPFDIAAALEKGSPQNRAFIEDLDRHADYLKQLAEARIPVLWRPFHEIDGGWFWWTDMETPENTAGLWRLTFDFLVNQRELHNLIWVYNASLRAGKMGKDVVAIEYRKRFYPGADHVDLSGIDIYPNDWYGWKDFRDDSYGKAFEIMSQVSPGKMLAMSECQAIPNPDKMQSEGPKWLYVLPWWAGNEKNPEDWVKRTYGHELLVTRDELPESLGHSKAASP